jgi:hypothetical protein
LKLRFAIMSYRFVRLVWPIINRFDYAITHVLLRVVDWTCGLEPRTAADQRREEEHERLQPALPRST